MGLYIVSIKKLRSGRCIYRKAIPAPLRPFCGGRWEFKVTLGREEEPGFHSRCEAAKAEHAAMIARAKRCLEGAYDPLDAPRIAYLAELFRAQYLAEDEEARFSPDDRELFLATEEDLEARSLAQSVNWGGAPVRRWAEKTRETTSAMLHVYRDLKAIGDLDGMVDVWEEEAQLLFESANLAVNQRDTEGMRQLCRALNDAAIRACHDKLRRLGGDDVPTPLEPSLASALEGKPRTVAKISLRTIYEGYAAAQGLTPGVRDEWRRYIELLVEYLGHEDASRLTTAELIDWRDKLLREPTRKGTPRNPTTVRDKYITSVRACLTWAVEERLLPTNPAASVVVRVPKKAKLRDPDFTTTEAKAILTAALIPASPRMAASHVRARRWIPWLCAYTGARVNEFSQLRGEDVQQIDDIWTVRITPEAGTVKTNEARIVPIHEHLIEQGFIDMVKSQGSGPLFYEPGRQRIDSESNRHFKKVGERLAEWVRKDVGITDPGLKPNHAWRHTFKSMSYTLGIEERLVDAIQGHAPKTTGRRYGKAPLAALAEAIGKIPRFEVQGA